jgi:hypothetical protein
MAELEQEAALRTLRTRVRSTLQHFELVEAALSLVEAVADRAADRKQPLTKALGVQGKYETLQLPAQQARQIGNFSRGENQELALVALHYHFMTYLRDVLPAVHRRQPLGSLIAGTGGDGGEPGEIPWERLLLRFEGRGGVEDLVGRLIAATGIRLDPEVGREAHGFLAMRDLYVFNGGLVDEEFARLHGASWNAVPGHKLPRNLKIGRSAAHAIERFALDLDAALKQVGAE